MKNNYVLILFAEKNIVSATSDMRKYIFPKKMFVLCLSRVSRVCFSRYPFSCHVVPFPLFRPPLTRVYEKQLFLDTILLKKTLYRQRQACESTFSQKKCSFCIFLVFIVFFFSRYPFSSHGALLVSTHTVSRALRFLMFNVFSVLLLSFYLVLCLSRVSRVFFSVPVLVPGRSVSVVPAIVNLCL